MKNSTQRPSGLVIGLAISGIVVVALAAVSLYFFRDIVGGSEKASVGRCLREAFYESSKRGVLGAEEQDQKSSDDVFRIPLPTIDVHVNYEHALPPDLGIYSVIAATCCGDVGQDVAGCATALRGFVDATPDAEKYLSNTAPAIQEAALKLTSETTPAREAAPARRTEPSAIQAVLDETDPAVQARKAFALFASADDFLRADALRKFYASSSPTARRAAIVYLLEQTKGGRKSLPIEASLPSGDVSTDAEKQQRIVRSLVGMGLQIKEIDRGTGAFRGGFGGHICEGTVSEEHATFGTGMWRINLSPLEEHPALGGTLTDKDGVQVAIEVRLM